MLALGWFLLGCGEQRPRHVVLITLDTTRADHLGAYGYEAAKTARLDSLASRGVLYERAYAAAPETLPSHASMLTGLYPPSHGARLNGSYRLDSSASTLAELLGEQGFRTAAVVASRVLARVYGLDQGFEIYDEPTADERRAAEVTEEALAAASESTGERLFLWAHYYDPHSPFDPPGRSPTVAAESVELYDGEIAYVDEMVGRLLDGLGELEILDDALVVVVADHGEGLGDHGETYHTHFVYDSTIRVPLIVAGPGVPAARRVSTPVAGLDVFATILESVGVEAPATASVPLPLEEAATAEPERFIYSESLSPAERFGWAPLAALRSDDWIYVEAPVEELYRHDDPVGSANRASRTDRQLARTLQRHQEALADLRNVMEAQREIGAESARVLSESERGTLESLGYLTAPSASSKGAAEDPKDMIEVAEAIAVSRMAVRNGRLDVAERLLAWAAASDPENGGVLLHLGRAQADRGDLETAHATLLRADRLRPATAEILVDLAVVGEAIGAESAALHLEAALAVAPAPTEVWRRVARGRLRSGRESSAGEAFRELLLLAPDDVEALASVATRESGSR